MNTDRYVNTTEIAEILNRDKATVSRNKKKMPDNCKKQGDTGAGKIGTLFHVGRTVAWWRNYMDNKFNPDIPPVETKDETPIQEVDPDQNVKKDENIFTLPITELNRRKAVVELQLKANELAREKGALINKKSEMRKFREYGIIQREESFDFCKLVSFRCAKMDDPALIEDYLLSEMEKLLEKLSEYGG